MTNDDDEMMMMVMMIIIIIHTPKGEYIHSVCVLDRWTLPLLLGLVYGLQLKMFL